MKQVIATRLVDIPDEVTFEVRARKVRVKGPRGEHQRHSQPVTCKCSTQRRNILIETAAAVRGLCARKANILV